MYKLVVRCLHRRLILTIWKPTSIESILVFWTNQKETFLKFRNHSFQSVHTKNIVGWVLPSFYIPTSIVIVFDWKVARFYSPFILGLSLNLKSYPHTAFLGLKQLILIAYWLNTINYILKSFCIIDSKTNMEIKIYF